MKQLIVALGLALASVAASPFAHAQSRAEVREVRQQQRIEAGAAEGQLNHREVRRIEHGQARVANATARAEADGVVTRREAHHIDHLQNVQSRRIERARHNGR